jgi:hypothetical protein
MISRLSGEVTFQDLRILPQAVLPSALLKEKPVGHSGHFPIPGWSGHQLGLHRSDIGPFQVEVLCAEGRIQVVLLAHVRPLANARPFYEQNTPGDAERRAFHEGLISSELAGQREFSWGEVLCRYDKRVNKDWLVIAYNQGPHVPVVAPEVPLYLQALELFPRAA